jgi:hypothetical protein
MDGQELSRERAATDGVRASGRIGELERRMERHEQNWQRAKGFLAAASVALAVLEFAVEAWFRK